MVNTAEYQKLCYRAATENDANLALEVCKVILENNLRINHTVITAEGKDGHAQKDIHQIKTRYGGICIKCNVWVPPGETVGHRSGMGIWHEEC